MHRIIFILALFLLTTELIFSQTLEDNLIAHYTFDDNNSIGTDDSGNGETATLHGSPATTSDRNGNPFSAVLLNGETDYLRMPSSVLSSSSSFSAACWVRVDGQNSAPSTGNETASLIDFRAQYNMSLSVKTGHPTYGNKFRFMTQDGSLQVDDLYSNTEVVYGNWHHVAIVYNGTTMELYVDGYLEESISCNQARSYSGGHNNLGKDYNSGANRCWLNGALDDVRIYDRALASSEVATLAIYNPDAETPANEILSGYGFYGDGERFGVGTEYTHGYRLAVAGGILAEEVKVQLEANWPDYVFDREYNLLPLDKLESYIKENQHLPGVPSAQDVAKNGVLLGQMDARLLEKVEELTLHVIELSKQNEQQQAQIEMLLKQNAELMKLLDERTSQKTK